MLNVNGENFTQEVLDSEKPVVVDFWAEWCGPCRMVGPVFSELEKEMEDVKFAKLNVDENMELSSRYGVSSIPAFVIFRGGQPVGSFVGYRPKGTIKELIEKAL
jgi:thioredoxin 1